MLSCPLKLCFLGISKPVAVIYCIFGYFLEAVVQTSDSTFDFYDWKDICNRIFRKPCYRSIKGLISVFNFSLFRKRNRKTVLWMQDLNNVTWGQISPPLYPLKREFQGRYRFHIARIAKIATPWTEHTLKTWKFKNYEPRKV